MREKIMIKALSPQFNYAGNTIDSYGFDTTKTIQYKFNSSGFRSTDEYESTPDMIFSGGSISFGIGMSLELCYPFLVSDQLKNTHWNISYAADGYNNKVIYDTIINLEVIAPIIIQWVSDLRDPKYSVSNFISEVNKKFPIAIHMLIDGREDRHNYKESTLVDLVNPIKLDLDVSGTHFGAKTHLAIAKYLIAKLKTKYHHAT